MRNFSRKSSSENTTLGTETYTMVNIKMDIKETNRTWPKGEMNLQQFIT